MKTFLFRENRIRYLDEGDGIPVILLHNGGNDHALWEYQVPLFEKTHRVIAPDLPGYGVSDRPRINYSLYYYTDFIEAFIEHLGADRPVLVGNCIGSAMSLQYALEYPEKVRALVLFNLATENTLRHGIFGFMYGMMEKSPRIRNVFSQVSEIEGFSRMVRMAGFRVLYGKTGDPDPMFGKHIEELYGHPDQMKVLYNLLSNFASFRKLDGVAKPDDFPPCCMIWGRQNHVLSAEHGDAFNRAFGPDDSYALEGCGHMVMRENHEEVNRIITDFLFRNGAFFRGSK